MATIFDKPTIRPVTICGSQLTHATHICAFFDSSEQEYDCITSYFSEGLERGEQVVTIRDAGQCTAHVEELRQRLPQDIDRAMASDQLRVVATEETYLKDGCFEADRMYAMLEDLLQHADEGPFDRVRTCGDMTWALRAMPGTDELMEYESRANKLTREHDCTLMCVYDVNLFSGRAVMDVLATHPMVVMGDRIYENPYFVEPTDFIRTLLKRGSAPLSRHAS